jgi:hypothetical protein
VLGSLVAAGALAALLARAVSWRGVGQGAGALALGAALLIAANYAVAGRLAWTPGGPALLFGRMLNDGIVQRFLAERCPDPRLPKLCAHRGELPDDADMFFWGEGVFDRLGRFAGLGEEMRTVVLQSLRDYPALQIRAAAVAAVRQLSHVGTGEGVLNTLWHSYAIVEQFVPSAVPAMRAARQQRGELDFAAVNRLHVPVAYISMLLLVPLIVLGLRYARYTDLGRLAATAALALLANAAVCGTLANPHDRYGARIVWIAAFAVLLWMLRSLVRRPP